MSEIYESKDYIVIDEDCHLVGEFDTREEAAKFIDEMQELGRQNFIILGPVVRGLEKGADTV